MIDAVNKWIGEQPTYLRTAYKAVMEKGTAGEVHDVFERFRTATGTPGVTPQKSQAPAPVAAAQPKSKLLPAAKQAVASLAPVGSKRASAPVTNAVPESFEDAFKHFSELEAANSRRG
jgi:hypothetical protein